MKRKVVCFGNGMLLAGFLVLATQACKKTTVPDLNTAAVSSITQTTAVSGGTIADDGGAAVIATGVCWSTTPGPTVDNTKTQDGPAESAFTSNISGLSAGTTYYIRAYATNSEGTGYGNELSFTTAAAATTVTDYDGNTYHIITIGTQTWLLENLRTIHYRNGDPIPNVTSGTSWNDLSTGAYCDYNNNSGSYRDDYGIYYNWAAVNDSRNIAPVGYHVPSYTEFMTLVNFLGGQAVAGGKLKEAGFTHWNSPNTGSTNESGFTAVGGGFRDYDGSFSGLMEYAELWTTTAIDAGNAYSLVLYYNLASCSFGTQNKKDGFNVRCIKD